VGVTRLLFWGLMGLLFYAVLRKLAQGGDSRTGGGPRRAPGDALAEDMVRCAACGLNLPKSEGIPVDGRWACCEEHARKLRAADRP
jgi:uncharacterized protein